VAFSADAKTLFSVSADRTIRLWEVATFRERQRLTLTTRPSGSAVFSPDRRWVAWRGNGKDCTVTVWDLVQNRELRRLTGHQTALTCLGLSADGKTLFSGSMDGMLLLSDVSRLPLERPAPVRLGEDELAGLWKALGDEDAARAYEAMGRLALAPDQTAALVEKNLRPVADFPDAKRLSQLLDDLDADEFRRREMATRALEELGRSVEGALRQAAEKSPSAEVRTRARQLLARLGAEPGSERLRRLRAVELLEQIHTPETRKVLQGLADGAAGAGLTEEARAALARMK
jgi:hypothetical protein